MQNVKQFLIDNNYDFKEDISFKVLTTYKTGGTAKYVVFPNDVEHLKRLLDYLKLKNIPFKIFGNGSNILASDNDYDGVIIKLNKLNNQNFDDGNLYVEAGCNMIQVANKYSKMGYYGLDFACGIPGTLGGAIYMNAGAYLEAIGDSLQEVTYLDEGNNVETIKKEDMKLGYRTSIFKEKPWVILSAKLVLKKGNKEEIIDLLSDRMRRRASTQPLEYPSAGSVFRNPEKMYAGALIENCGLKGKKRGDAQISDKHANFIVNKDQAKSKDIKYLMDLAKNKVKKQYKIDLLIEQELFNWE